MVRISSVNLILLSVVTIELVNSSREMEKFLTLLATCTNIIKLIKLHFSLTWCNKTFQQIFL